MPNDPDDDSYRPVSEGDESLGNEGFIVPEARLKPECFKRQLIATARSLKKKQQQLQADQDLLIDRWTDVLAAEEYGLKRPAKIYPKRKLLPQFDDEAPEPVPSSRNAADDHHAVRIKRQLKPNTRPPHLAVKAGIKQLGIVHMTFGRA